MNRDSLDVELGAYKSVRKEPSLQFLGYLASKYYRTLQPNV